MLIHAPTAISVLTAEAEIVVLLAIVAAILALNAVYGLLGCEDAQECFKGELISSLSTLLGVFGKA